MVDVLATGAPSRRVTTGIGLAKFTGLVIRFQVGNLDEISVGGFKTSRVLGFDGIEDFGLNFLFGVL